MRVGLLVEVEEGLDWDSWRATYASAERLGFESVWLSDHLQSPWEARKGLETWTALAVAAAQTSRLVLGPLVSPVTFREGAILARMAESLNQLSAGRFVAGIGLGWNEEEHAAAGIAFPPATSRSRRLAETAERIRREAPGVPILIGGSGARLTLPLVARYADQWNMTTASPSAFADASRKLDGLCAEIDRDQQTVVRSIACGMLVGLDDADLQARAEKMRACIPPLADAPDVLASARERGWLVGTVLDVVPRLREFAAAGAQRVMLGHYNLGDLDVLELLASRVLPVLA
jgi:alkanesulfonate monooxygenase SsuD/methylene tetrahydromethanopterin reductase-like flavin-dependent oxidoreductase (luciferase family)